MANHIEDKIAARKLLVRLRTAALTGLDEAAQDLLLAAPLRRCVRFNPLVEQKTAGAAAFTTAYTGPEHPDYFDQPGWLPDDCTLPRDPLPQDVESGLQALLASGAAYLQNPSSFIPVFALDPKPGEKILDLCASPGGKTSLIAAISGNMAEITANDYSFDRLQKLRRVSKLLHTKVAEFTMVKGEASSRKFAAGSFDKILIDAPCSGEDIRLLAEKDLGSWSPAKVKRLAELQKKLLKEAWKLLKPGGLLAYSTCSQAPEENEAVISWFLQTHDDAGSVALQGHTSIPDLLGQSIAQPALREWNGREYHSGLRHAVRIIPSDTHISFFTCLLQKSP